MLWHIISFWWPTFAFTHVLCLTKVPRSQDNVVEVQRESAIHLYEGVVVEGLWDVEGDADNMWVKMATCIRKVASRCLGEPKPKDTWWWN